MNKIKQRIIDFSKQTPLTLELEKAHIELW